jgi:hypothetical protein
MREEGLGKITRSKTSVPHCKAQWRHLFQNLFQTTNSPEIYSICPQVFTADSAAIEQSKKLGLEYVLRPVQVAVGGGGGGAKRGEN